MLEAFAKLFKGSRRGQGLLAEVQREVDEAEQARLAREAAFPRLAAAEKRLLAESPKLAQEIAALEADIQKCFMAYLADEKRKNARLSELHGRHQSLLTIVERERGIIARLADDRIQKFVGELLRLDDETRQRFESNSQEARDENWQRVTVTNSNGPAINRRRDAIRVALEAAEALALEHLDEAAVQKRIEALRATIPGADTLNALESTDQPTTVSRVLAAVGG